MAATPVCSAGSKVYWMKLLLGHYFSQSGQFHSIQVFYMIKLLLSSRYFSIFIKIILMLLNYISYVTESSLLDIYTVGIDDVENGFLKPGDNHAWS